MLINIWVGEGACTRCWCRHVIYAFTTPAGQSGRIDGPVGANAGQVGSYMRLARRRKVRCRKVR
jgi:hypothetical protein